jgi:hypothetical protein
MIPKTALLAVAAMLPFSFAQISDDFEGGLDTSKWATYAPDCNQGGSISLDKSTGHSGSSSVKVNGAGGYCGHIFFGTTSVPSGDVYVRTWLKASKAFNAAHVTFITMPDSGLGTNKHLRIGGQSNILMYNRESDDATLPDLSPQGISASAPLPANKFVCFEYHLGTDGTIETWLDGTAIGGLRAGPGANNPNGAQWERGSYKPKIKGIYFGWESYGGDTNTFWYDDVAIGSSRQGCGSGTTNPPTNPPDTTATSQVSSFTTSVASTAPPPSSTAAPGGPTQVKWGQCGGTGWSGPTACESGSTCKVVNDWYHQCV